MLVFLIERVFREFPYVRNDMASPNFYKLCVRNHLWLRQCSLDIKLLCLPKKSACEIKPIPRYILPKHKFQFGINIIVACLYNTDTHNLCQIKINTT